MAMGAPAAKLPRQPPGRWPAARWRGTRCVHTRKLGPLHWAPKRLPAGLLAPLATLVGLVAMSPYG